jgi:hypothetical protein
MLRWLGWGERPVIARDDPDDPTASVPTAQLTTTRKSFPTGIKLLFNGEDSIVE